MNKEQIKYFFPKLYRRIASLRKLLWPYCNMERVATRGYFAYLNAVSFKSRLRFLLGEFTPDLLAGISEEDKAIIVETAEQALRHEFDLLGSGVVKNDPIDWQTDLKSGKRWGKQFYTRIPRYSGADIKMPWELSRCQHLLWLGEAYLLKGESRYAKEVIDEIDWWIDDNPLMYTVNWTCAMDVAFRSVNWLFALNMIAGYEGFDDAFAQKVMRSLWQHGFFIRNNLEQVIPDSNNHYTSDLVGLLYIGALFDLTKGGRKWKRFASKELRTETLNQVLPSGVHYERTVSYQRMMAEMLSYPVYMMIRIGETVSEDVLMRINAMYSYIANYTKPNGLAPIIGDNDDGRFVPFIKRDFRDHNYLNDPDSLENRMISVGMEPLFCSNEMDSKLYEDARVAVVHEGNNYLFVNCGGYSRRPKEEQESIGTHTHNDLLSFELALNGKDIIVDAGTYLYTSSKKDRDAFRSTSKHNTVMVDDEEQNDMPGTFVLKRNILIKNIVEEQGRLTGQYQTIKGQMTHQRTFSLKQEGLSIKDKLSKKGKNHLATFYFHLSQSITPEINEKRIVLDSGQIIMFANEPNSLEIIDDTLSPSFGSILKSKTLKISYRFNDELLVETSIISNSK